MNQEKFTQLKILGLSEKEIKTYIALLKFEKISILKLSRNTKINRSSLYPILDNLLDLGIIKITRKKKRKLYYPLNPSHIKQIINERKEALNLIKPQLIDLHKNKSESYNIKFYKEKINFFSKINPQTKNKKSELLYIGALKDLYKTFPDFEKKFQKKETKNLKLRAIVNSDKESKTKTAEINRAENINIKLLPSDLFFLRANFLIYHDKIFVNSLSENFFMIEIKSKILSNSHKAIFELAWTSANTF